MDTQSTHVLVEYRGCPPALLDDRAAIEAAMHAAAREAEATVVGAVFHTFAPQGVSGVVVVEESHLSIHTWPECGYAAVDVFTCGDCRPTRAAQYLGEALGATRVETMVVDRGLEPTGRSIAVRDHRVHDHNPPRPAPESSSATPPPLR